MGSRPIIRIRRNALSLRRATRGSTLTSVAAEAGFSFNEAISAVTDLTAKSDPPYATLDQVALDIQNGKVPIVDGVQVGVTRLEGPDLDRAAGLRELAREKVQTRLADLRESQKKLGIATAMLAAASIGFGCLGATVPALVDSLPVVSNWYPFLPEAMRGAVLMALPTAIFAAFSNLSRQLDKQRIEQIQVPGSHPLELQAERISQPHWAEHGKLIVRRRDPLGPATELYYRGIREPDCPGEPSQGSFPLNPHRDPTNGPGA